MPDCWICGRPGETSEHRIKKSDLVLQYGRGPYREADALFHYRGDEVALIQGPNSSRIRYDKILCADCNNAKTQPFDKAYEKFTAWTKAHRDEIVARRVIDFQSIYGPGWEDVQRDLFKYFAKCFGCRVAETGRAVPADVVELLGQVSFTTAFYVTFVVDEDFLDAGVEHLGIEPLLVHTERSTGEESGFSGGHSVGWLTMLYWYHHFSATPCGSRWIADAQYVYLGWRRSLSQRS